jgi:rhodanese-related sulfurtransferase/DNA-binding transcriptional ArsR family regulator
MHPSNRDATYPHAFDQPARAAKALASPRRLQLIALLERGEGSVEALAGLAGMAVANTSRHLQVLRAAGMVEARREGTFAHYRLTDDRMLRVLAALQEVGRAPAPPTHPARRAPVDDRPVTDGITARELAARRDDPRLLILDVRPRGEYGAGHIPGALSVPLADLDALWPRLPHNRDWIAYSGGPQRDHADEAVAALGRRGFSARRLLGGLPAWRAEGFAVEIGR